MKHTPQIVAFTATLVAFFLNLVSTVSVSWLQSDNEVNSTLIGLWRVCKSWNDGTYTCENIYGQKNYAYVNAARVFMVISCVLGLVYMFFIPRVEFGEKRTTSKIQVAAMCATALLVFLATTIYAGRSSSLYPGYHFGFSIIIGWISIPVQLIGGYMTWRSTDKRFSKKEEYEEINT